MACLTASRGRTGGYFLTSCQRRLSVRELGRFQGFKHTDHQFQKTDMTRGEIGFAYGDSMSCNILERLLPRVLAAAKLCPHVVKKPWVDPNFDPYK